MRRMRLLGIAGISLVTVTLAIGGAAFAEPPPQTVPQAQPPSPVPTTVRGAAFLAIDGLAIKGDATDAGHKDWIEISSFSYGRTQTGTGGASGAGSAAGRADLSSIQITKKQDKSSPALQRASNLGTHFKTVVLELRKAGANASSSEYYRVTMSNVFVSKIAFKGSSDPGAGLNESLTLDFAKIVVEYAPQNADGSAGKYQTVKDDYDVRTNVRL